MLLLFLAIGVRLLRAGQHTPPPSLSGVLHGILKDSNAARSPGSFRFVHTCDRQSSGADTTANPGTLDNERIDRWPASYHGHPARVFLKMDGNGSISSLFSINPQLYGRPSRFCLSHINCSLPTPGISTLATTRISVFRFSIAVINPLTG